MTPAQCTQLQALRIALDRLQTFDCPVEHFRAVAGEQPYVRLAAATSELLDHLDARQTMIGAVFGLHIAELDGCAVAWPAASEPCAAGATQREAA